ncbi:hypothetical protein C8J56DRAFT_892758 [Mycena floridula]|nr:hypothetical protein C8J56DRAFT_892758 [Mycena floridula]
MSAARESSIASSRQASPHAEVPTVPEEPINPEIAVLPVAPSSPVASSSPESNEPVPEPDELEGDAETPTKPKKGGKPSPSTALRSPVDEAQPEPSPRPKPPSPGESRLYTSFRVLLLTAPLAASLRGSPKPTSPVMPASKAPSEHQPSASPPPASPKTPVPTILRDPRFRIHSVRQSVYRELIENPDPRPPLSADQMNRLQLGADDLNYWGYVIDIMYRQLSEVTNPVQQVAIITTIAAMFLYLPTALGHYALVAGLKLPRILLSFEHRRDLNGSLSRGL